ncbi:hypothetical protein HELRODRAFT_169950 [Helobdella robusta]|uniref:Membrane protein BRI3 n=1 Tax=Helobdella robusta TaxID=6412 RepID=T1F2H0_HELRO|nr:hypothetical protein HELRODRAFT_169950 [Helobdella robusta]ESO08211.1 hypothetical protein HELRODRAFT_169950 [Helobdella robusta]
MVIVCNDFFGKLEKPYYPPQLQPQYPPQGPPYPPQGPPYPPQQPYCPTQPAQPTNTVVITGPIHGSCPKCNRGIITPEYTACGIILAICFFPIGILCCIAMRENTCSVCRARF